jgi:preprotein translocase SecE subunit
LMFSVHLIAPIVLAVLLVWAAWRSVNIPGFADFLIATEAEMNKVSWTNRRRLYQDTIVVLVTVFLFTGFLFVVDIIWIKVLSAPGIQVLLLDPREQAAKNEQKAQW